MKIYFDFVVSATHARGVSWTSPYVDASGRGWSGGGERDDKRKREREAPSDRERERKREGGRQRDDKRERERETARKSERQRESERGRERASTSWTWMTFLMPNSKKTSIT